MGTLDLADLDVCCDIWSSCISDDFTILLIFLIVLQGEKALLTIIGRFYPIVFA